MANETAQRATQKPDRNTILARIWTPAVEVWGREAADYFIHAHTLAEFGVSSLRRLSYEELLAVAAWIARTLEGEDEPN